MLRGRQVRLPHAARRLPDVAQVPADHSSRRGLRHQAAGRGQPLRRRRRAGHEDRRFDAITARSVILATGGLGRVYAFTTNGHICTGDGMALAYRAGVGLEDREMVQFHPTGLPFTGILITEAVRGEGGYLLNNEGERFLKRYVPNKMELGPGDILSRAM